MSNLILVKFIGMLCSDMTYNLKSIFYVKQVMLHQTYIQPLFYYIVFQELEVLD